MSRKTLHRTATRSMWMELTRPDLMGLLMESRGVSGRALAKAACCTEGTIRHLLHGRMTSCTPDLAARICLALGLSDTSLLFDGKVSTSDTHAHTVAIQAKAA